MPNHLRLAERVEQASGPDAEADYLIHALVMGWRTPDEINCFSWCVGENYQFGRPDDERRAIYISESDLPNYTASLDAALTLVPEGWFLSIKQTSTYEWRTFTAEDDSPLPNWTAQLIPEGPNPDKLAWRDRANGEGATPALALCAAALKARSQAGEAP